MRDAIVIGLILAAIILVLFLRDWGSSIVAGLVIPATIAVTFIALRLLGESFNLMTLGGLAAAVGLVIDDAIVVVENIVMHRDSGQTPLASHPQRIERDPQAAGWFDGDSHRGVPSADFNYGSDGHFLSRSGNHRGRRAAHLVGARAHVDAGAQPSALSALAERMHDADTETGTGFMGRITGLYERLIKAALAHPLVLTAFAAAHCGLVFLLQVAGQRPAACDGRGRIRVGLPDAGRLRAFGYEPRPDRG